MLSKECGCFSHFVFQWIVAISGVMCFAHFAQATERREFYNGARGLGMGDTGVAIVNDETALLVNPAGLGRLRNFYGTIFDPELDIGSKVPDMHRADAFSQPFNIADVLPTAVSSPGTYYHARGMLFPSFVARNFGIGLLVKNTLDAEAASATSVNTFYRDDMALILGYNLRLWDGRIKLGFTGKVISRLELNESALDSTGALDNPSLAAAGKLKEGVGVGGDLGLMLTAPWTWLPTLAAVAHDVGGTKFNQMTGVRSKDAIATPDEQLQDLDVGFSVSPIHRNNLRSMWTIEYRNVLTASSETDKAKLIHFGVEANLGDVFFLRAGYNQRYWTAGAELSSERFQIQVANYGEEIGDETTPREDRRTVLKIAFRF